MTHWISNGIDNKKDVVIAWIFVSQELGYKDREVWRNLTNTSDVPVKFDDSYLNKVMNRISSNDFVI